MPCQFLLYNDVNQSNYRYVCVCVCVRAHAHTCPASEASLPLTPPLHASEPSHGARLGPSVAQPLALAVPFMRGSAYMLIPSSSHLLLPCVHEPVLYIHVSIPALQSFLSTIVLDSIYI